MNRADIKKSAQEHYDFLRKYGTIKAPRNIFISDMAIELVADCKKPLVETPRFH